MNAAYYTNSLSMVYFKLRGRGVFISLQHLTKIFKKQFKAVYGLYSSEKLRLEVSSYDGLPMECSIPKDSPHERWVTYFFQYLKLW